MEKLLIKLTVPELRTSYDILVPQDVPVKKLLPIIINGLKDLSNGAYVSSGMESLIAQEDEKLMFPDRTLFDYSIRNGDKLLIL